MQHPTCTDLRVKSISDAQVIFYAVSKGVLPIVSRRLDSEERRCIRSGSVYVWEERGPDAEATGLGIERWTDGIRWGPSRVRDEFLFYHEKDMEKDMDIVGHPFSLHLPPGSYFGRPRERLVKQTYSVFVETPRGRRKWHLIAYFTQETIDALYTVEDFPDLARLRVPQGRFRSARSAKGRPRDSEHTVERRGASPHYSSPVYAPYSYTPPPSDVMRPHSMSPLHPTLSQDKEQRVPRSMSDSSSPKSEAQIRTLFNYTPEGTQVLAPLAFLENTHIPKRHPVDDRALRSFSVA